VRSLGHPEAKCRISFCFQTGVTRSPLFFFGSFAFVLIYAIAILFSVLTMIELRKRFFNLGVNRNAQAIQRQLTIMFVAQVRIVYNYLSTLNVFMPCGAK
jgi:hypothetical protein